MHTIGEVKVLTCLLLKDDTFWNHALKKFLKSELFVCYWHENEIQMCDNKLDTIGIFVCLFLLAVSAFDNRGTYTHICVYDYTQMPSQLHTIACSSLGAISYLEQFLVMLKSQA